MWLFLASEAMLFGSLFSAYVMLRAGSVEWPGPFQQFPWVETALLVGASAAFGNTRLRLIGANALGLAFVAIAILNNASMIARGLTPSASLQLACWFTLTAIHAFHVLACSVFSGWIAGPGFGMGSTDRPRWMARIDATRRYWIFVDLVWLFIVAGFFLF